ncbi:hypothetical protein F2P56_004841 [Juglans regia]|uniref:YqgF/RNase H-like domain-containing protein n=2 Tax=Juglans regia TaxID=51240 RepID=A0A834D8H8_JUGRE|nr:putative pre-16S rRNA nuclease [Juglans regia]XP_018852478.1 putative pre-16S rRNA nuclease [Juglans regia]KAF5478266.1 hypothetical protein F2P56_004840 [Juglans regia]KAF5478267.1 hypothetical protein F2P56_004841 [Juglans regia]
MRYVKPLNLFRDLVKSNVETRGRLLGLDVGEKYVGLAVSDPHNKTASPLSVLIRKQPKIDLMISDFQSLISELSLVGFVVGDTSNKIHGYGNTVQVKLFIDDLCKTGKLECLKYTYWDENFSSKSVDFLLKPLDLHPVIAKTTIDKFAAVGILQGYLDYFNRKMKLEAAE